jgi:hypothetical protein
MAKDSALVWGCSMANGLVPVLATSSQAGLTRAVDVSGGGKIPASGRQLEPWQSLIVRSTRL